MAKPRLDDPLTAEQLRALLTYIPSTGAFVWKPNPLRPKEWNTKYSGTQAGTILPRGYVQVMVNSRLYLAHRLAYLWMTGSWPESEVDHRNGDGTDNAWGNLRAATSSQQKMNKRVRSDSQSGIKGITLDRRRGLWSVRIEARGQRYWFGYFKTAEEASAARAEAAARLHGEFAR
jgi:hypothetical protein